MSRLPPAPSIVAWTAGLLLVLSASGPDAAPADRKSIVIRAVVTGLDGSPLAGAEVAVDGPARRLTLANEQGRFTLELPGGTVGELSRRSARYTIDVKHRGARIPVSGGPVRLEIGLEAREGEDRIEVRCNAEALERELTEQLSLPGNATAVLDVEFTRRSAGPPPRAQGREAKATPPRAEPPRETASKKGPPPGAPASSAPASSAPAASAPPTTAPQTRREDSPPAAPSETSAAFPPVKLLGRDERSTAMEVLEQVRRFGSITAAEQHADSVRAAEREQARREAAERREAERAAERAERESRHLRAEEQKRLQREHSTQARRERAALAADAALTEKARREAEERDREAMKAAVLAADRAHRDSMKSAEGMRARAMEERRREERSRAEAARAEAKRTEAARAEAKRAEAARDQAKRADAERAEAKRAQARRAEVARATSPPKSDEAPARPNPERARPATRASSPPATREKSPQRSASAASRGTMEREAMLRSLQVRDSVRHVAYVEEQGRIAARRDSARAARPIPERDPRPPIGGRSIAAVPGDSCACRIQGTVELRSEGRLSRPLRVTVALRGLSGIRSTVELFMGSPRPFTLERVQCGSLSLEVTWNSGRRYRLEDPAAARELSCRDGRLLQPRLILVPE